MEQAPAPHPQAPGVRATRRVGAAVRQPLRPGGWWFDAGVAASFAAVTAALAWSPIRELDLAMRDLADAHRPAAAESIAEWLNRLGSGGLLTGLALLVAIWLAWRMRSLWPLTPVVAALLLTLVVITPVKLLTHRAAPHSPLPDDVEVRLFSQPGGLSYPSGHAVNTIVWYGVLALLLAAWLRAGWLRAGWLRAGSAGRRWFRFAPPVIVGVVGTYLGFHWLTDMLAGFCLGVLIDRLLTRLPWPLPTQPTQPAHARTPQPRH